MTSVKLRVSGISKLHNNLSFGVGLSMQVILDINGLTESAWSSCPDLAWLETWYHPRADTVQAMSTVSGSIYT